MHLHLALAVLGGILLLAAALAAFLGHGSSTSGNTMQIHGTVAVAARASQPRT